jgi:DUF4097 and DUF4098 domain-containing protein YvlB
MEWNFVAVGPVVADVQVPSGEINLHPETDGEVHVSLEPASSSQRAMEVVEASRVTFESGRLAVHVPSRTFKNAPVLCTVRMPVGSSVTIKTASADVRCTGTVGDFEGSSASGDIEIGNIEGQLSLTTASGDVRCDRVSHRTRVRGASADVTIGHAGGPVELSLASGDVEIDDAGSSVKVDTASGDVVIRCAHEGEIRTKTAAGDITVGVAPGVGAYLDVRSVSGEMTCTLPFDESRPSEAKLSIVCNSISGDVAIIPAGA